MDCKMMSPISQRRLVLWGRFVGIGRDAVVRAFRENRVLVVCPADKPPWIERSGETWCEIEPSMLSGDYCRARYVRSLRRRLFASISEVEAHFRKKHPSWSDAKTHRAVQQAWNNQEREYKGDAAARLADEKDKERITTVFRSLLEREVDIILLLDTGDGRSPHWEQIERVSLDTWDIDDITPFVPTQLLL